MVTLAGDTRSVGLERCSGGSLSLGLRAAGTARRTAGAGAAPAAAAACAPATALGRVRTEQPVREARPRPVDAVERLEGGNGVRRAPRLEQADGAPEEGAAVPRQQRQCGVAGLDGLEGLLGSPQACGDVGEERRAAVDVVARACLEARERLAVRSRRV